ncbi:CLUMA_CG021170, isoform A [Clunio marinus]|uniref:CLUMA_CG021170, isoform A n=1 Tax=Clunio marinus TaxID=568069 RepID=A0A1J1J6B1_9DIPT|nr:CLUMA_CG021170, isoform A [Clunio marinus]
MWKEILIVSDVSHGVFTQIGASLIIVFLRSLSLCSSDQRDVIVISCFVSFWAQSQISEKNKYKQNKFMKSFCRN